MFKDRDPRLSRLSIHSRQEGPSLIFMLLLVNLAAFALPQLFGAAAEVAAGTLSVAGLRRGEWWAVFTHIFVHRDWMHLISNMALLYLAQKRVLADTGPRHFLYIYLISGWTASAITLLLHPTSTLMGSSGCVAGIIGAFAALHPDRSITAWLGPFFPRLRARNFFFGLLFAEIFLEVFAMATEKLYNIPMIHGVAHSAHAAGLICGWLYARHLAPALNTLYHREDFFPQGLRRWRKEHEISPAAAHSGNGIPSTGAFPAGVTAGEEKSDDEFLREAVDPVLDKLYAQGMDSLTPEEQAILEEASNRFSRTRKQ